MEFYANGMPFWEFSTVEFLPRLLQGALLPAADRYCAGRIAVAESRSAKAFRWLHFPLIVLVAQLLCRELTQENEYLRTEKRILRSKLPRRIPFTDEERRALVDAALVMSRKLMRQVVSIVQPDTILAWQRRLEKQTWDYSDRRIRKPRRPRTPGHIEEPVCGMACAAHWGIVCPPLVCPCGAPYRCSVREGRAARGARGRPLCR